MFSNMSTLWPWSWWKAHIADFQVLLLLPSVLHKNCILHNDLWQGSFFRSVTSSCFYYTSLYWTDSYLQVAKDTCVLKSGLLSLTVSWLRLCVLVQMCLLTVKQVTEIKSSLFGSVMSHWKWSWDYRQLLNSDNSLSNCNQTSELYVYLWATLSAHPSTKALKISDRWGLIRTTKNNLV